ncbi:hypothetical protein P691DRAFT_764785 [Macrolepiota fuliginosa MF-IS2]|uniref:Uncharacterized protein n=1 Tax=Macrolepiota fuliginosa MF-IS2 TaxID=1400762 RepID=A0A9P5X154_9AGAR|nr:hypothetical protein P691DRAFT_764785 [Macrolepiota fuliginosa MF-IS2]
MDIYLFNDALAHLIKWIGADSFNKTDSNACEMLVKHIFKVAKDFNLVTIVTPPTPSPPPPCTRPHSDEEDIHMEPPAPTCMFSEAAMQTPAPLPMVATPPPPSTPVPSANPSPAAAMSSKPGPPPRPSFAEIIGIPYFKPRTTEPPNDQEIGDQLISSPIPTDLIEHAQFMCNLPKADSGTFWIDFMDSQ